MEWSRVRQVKGRGRAFDWPAAAIAKCRLAAEAAASWQGSLPEDDCSGATESAVCRGSARRHKLQVWRGCEQGAGRVRAEKVLAPGLWNAAPEKQERQ